MALDKDKIECDVAQCQANIDVALKELASLSCPINNRNTQDPLTEEKTLVKIFYQKKISTLEYGLSEFTKLRDLVPELVNHPDIVAVIGTIEADI